MDVEARALLLRRNWYALGACLALAAAGAVLASVAKGAEAIAWAWLPIVFGLLNALLIAARNGFPLSSPVTVRAASSGLTLNAEAAIPLYDVLEAKMSPRTKLESVVELTLTKRRRITLRLLTDDARQLLDALGVRRTRFTLTIAFWKRYLASCSLWLLWMLASWHPWHPSWRDAFLLIPVAMWAVPATLLFGLVRGTLVVGADGFTTRWLGQERFVRFADVANITPQRRWAEQFVDSVVRLRSGERLRFRPLNAPNSDQERHAEGRAMFDRLSDAYVQCHLNQGRRELATSVAREARSASAWLAGIDEMLRGGYRVATVPVTTLSELVADAGATRDARVGAAAALVRVGTDESRAKVRVAAEACAESELRDVLRAVADAEDDEAITTALGSLRA